MCDLYGWPKPLPPLFVQSRVHGPSFVVSQNSWQMGQLFSQALHGGIESNPKPRLPLTFHTAALPILKPIQNQFASTIIYVQLSMHFWGYIPLEEFTIMQDLLVGDVQYCCDLGINVAICNSSLHNCRTGSKATNRAVWRSNLN